ncbi:hypothetical protein NDU88_004841 [Pleurodeles waltl]|uniref:Uncharacterized protein n=1 Tax=Pleurodeles waltl TaxID=8319 RepID=A0AAV7UHI6_PLEWA|nr:hypothetical protein NDU88_004841 [Pleurodeles waltl]
MVKRANKKRKGEETTVNSKKEKKTWDLRQQNQGCTAKKTQDPRQWNPGCAAEKMRDPRWRKKRSTTRQNTKMKE